jgi:hypothetical protein
MRRVAGRPLGLDHCGVLGQRVAVTIAGPNGPEGDDLGVVACGHVSHGHDALVDIQADGPRARLGAWLASEFVVRSWLDMRRSWLQVSAPAWCAGRQPPHRPLWDPGSPRTECEAVVLFGLIHATVRSHPVSMRTVRGEKSPLAQRGSRRRLPYVQGSPSRPSLEGAGGMTLNHGSGRKEAIHGGHSSVVDEGALVRRVKLQHPLSVRVRTATHQ